MNAGVQSATKRHFSSVLKTASKTFKLASLQLNVTSDKANNLKTTRAAIEKASSQGADVVVLPECFNSPYSTSSFPTYAEQIPTVPTMYGEIDAKMCPTVSMLSQAAKDCNVILIGGSIPERVDNNNNTQEKRDNLYYNTCTIYNNTGDLIGTHRKVHLFDIDVPGKIKFMESDILSAGDSLTAVETPYGLFGIGICYDIRFPSLSALLTENDDLSMLIFPGAFNTTTGPLHWELLQRARAVDNQAYVVTASPSRSADPNDYQAWGHSSVVSPWGKVIATTGCEPDIVYAEIDLNQVDEIRSSIPIRKQKRTDLYTLASSSPSSVTVFPFFPRQE